MSQLRTRRFETGDEYKLSRLMAASRTRFRRPRSPELTRWLWHQAPGGPADSWLIEAKDASADWKIVGHHGLCPVRFTLGDQDLLCAKTFNTFLLPEFRTKFLYLRFEQECLRQAETRFDATYSSAPGTARLRKALGYATVSTWVHMVRGVQTPDALSRLVGLLARNYPFPQWNVLARAVAQVSAPSDRKSSLKLLEYDSSEAARAPFFANFWEEARVHAGMSPRRDRADLSWRFWRRPDSTYITLVYSWEGGARAYCVVNTTRPCAYCLEDIFVTPFLPELLEAFLDALFVWCAGRGSLLLSFFTTTDGQPAELLRVFQRHMHSHPLRRFRRPGEMPRRFSSRASLCGGEQALPWNVTNLLAPAEHNARISLSA